MLSRLKDALYFPVAQYFAFFARLRLARWKPEIVAVTGSNGKTTALHLLEARLGSVARYSHHRNSAFGICFDILGLGDATHSRWRWFLLAVLAPFSLFKAVPAEKFYIVECDADRPGEGQFLSSLLCPRIVMWLNSARTHSMRYEHAARRAGVTVDEAIAHEYGYFLERAGALCIVNGDDARIMAQTPRARARIEAIEERVLSQYRVWTKGTVFTLNGTEYAFRYLLPRDSFRAIAAANAVAAFLGIAGDESLASFMMPPGRSSVFEGIKNTTIIDSSYNSNADSMRTILSMVLELPGTKWLILGDMTEQGAQEREEHETVARMVASADFARVILVGPRQRAFALPILQHAHIAVESFEGPKEALEYLQRNIRGEEMLVFKGARFLEGIIEHILANKSDAAKLCRREPLWQKRRKEWGV